MDEAVEPVDEASTSGESRTDFALAFQDGQTVLTNEARPSLDNIRNWERKRTAPSPGKG